jgi:hypothetical protein
MVPPLSPRASRNDPIPKRWAEETEARIALRKEPTLRHGITLPRPSAATLKEITPTKRGAKQEAVRIRAWLEDPLAKRPLSSIRRKRPVIGAAGMG